MDRDKAEKFREFCQAISACDVNIKAYLSKEGVFMLEEAERNHGQDVELCTCLWCQGSTPIDTVVGECCWSEWKHEVDDLAALVRQLVFSLNSHNPGGKVQQRAMDYLKRHNLKGSILRAEDAPKD